MHIDRFVRHVRVRGTTQMQLYLLANLFRWGSGRYFGVRPNAQFITVDLLDKQMRSVTEDTYHNGICCSMPELKLEVKETLVMI